MSISGIQRRRLFEEMTRTFYASGEKPRLADILVEVSKYFSNHPAGTPLKPLQGFARRGQKSNIDYMNHAFYSMQHNLSVAYEASLEQVQDIMMITSVLQANLESLRIRRKALISKIDDYLFTLFNADGYFMSLSDSFDDLSLTDLSMTNAFVDTSMGKVSLPAVSTLTRAIPLTQIGNNPSISVLANGTSVSYRTMSPFANALDGLANTIWGIEVETDSATEVIASITVPVGGANAPAEISRIEFDPWGIEPVQLMVRTTTNSNVSANADQRRSQSIPLPSEYQNVDLEAMGFRGVDFDTRIITSANKIILADNLRRADNVHFLLRKAKPDYTKQTASGTTKYYYIFGAKDITFTEHVYDSSAVYVSKPLSIPSDLGDDHVIDAVTLLVQGSAPTNTELAYWVAADVDGATEIGEFEWKRINPLDRIDRGPEGIVRFAGAANVSVDIRKNPDGGDLQLLEQKIAAGTPPVELNPSPDIIPGVDIWRIAEFDDSLLSSSAKLEEGVNTVRILHTEASDSVDNDLAFWADYISGARGASEVYSRIDKGLGFFDGGAIGESGRFVYVETYLEAPVASELFIRNLRKNDANSKNWGITAYLNGVEVGTLDVGLDFLAVPWKFKEGLNHVILLITIPATTSDAPRVYDGKITLMEDANLNEFGTVKLATWNYVDFFTMQYNEVDAPFSFTIRETSTSKKEIISRRQPTDNLRFRYAKDTGKGPDAVRVKVDLKRSTDNPSVTPSLDLYRLRFLYA